MNGMIFGLCNLWLIYIYIYVCVCGMLKVIQNYILLHVIRCVWEDTHRIYMMVV